VLQIKDLELWTGSSKQKRQQDAGATAARRNDIQETLYTWSNSLSRKMWVGVNWNGDFSAPAKPWDPQPPTKFLKNQNWNTASER